MSGLKWPPAVVNPGPSHLAVWWICRACSPGGRFFRSSLMVTPAPPLFSVMVAVPALAPLASFISTLTELAAHNAAAVNNPAMAIRTAWFFMISPLDSLAALTIVATSSGRSCLTFYEAQESRTRLGNRRSLPRNSALRDGGEPADFARSEGPRDQRRQTQPDSGRHHDPPRHVQEASLAGGGADVLSTAPAVRQAFRRAVGIGGRDRRAGSNAGRRIHRHGARRRRDDAHHAASTRTGRCDGPAFP